MQLHKLNPKAILSKANATQLSNDISKSSFEKKNYDTSKVVQLLRYICKLQIAFETRIYVLQSAFIEKIIFTKTIHFHLQGKVFRILSKLWLRYSLLKSKRSVFRE